MRERYGLAWPSLKVPDDNTTPELRPAIPLRGQNLLLARRLVEIGVPFVNVYDFKVHGHAWPRFKLVADPEPASVCAGAALGYRVVDLCFETGAVNRDKAFRLSRGTGADGYSDSDSKDNLY